MRLLVMARCLLAERACVLRGSRWSSRVCWSARGAGAATPYDDLTPGRWRVISNNTIDDVDPCPEQNCAYSAVEGISAVIDDPAADNDVVPTRNPNGTYSRFRHVPSVNAFVLVSSTSGPVWMIRLSDKPGTGTNPGAGGGSAAGGAPGAATSGAGAGASPATDSGDSGCGCRLADRDGGARPLFAMLAAILALVRRRMRFVGGRRVPVQHRAHGAYENAYASFMRLNV